MKIWQKIRTYFVRPIVNREHTNETDQTNKQTKLNQLHFDLHKFHADNGNAFNQNTIGKYYLYGSYVDKNHILAVQYFTKSANQCDEIGLFYLAYCYQFGIGVELNLLEAIKFYRQSFRLNDSLGQFNLSEKIPVKIIDTLKLLDKNDEVEAKCIKLEEQVEKMQQQINELEIRVPIEGGIEYQKAKARFDAYCK